MIYSDDKDIENYAKRFNIHVIRICDLPLPPDSVEPDAKPVAVLTGQQQSLNLAPAAADVPATIAEVKPDGESAGTKEDNQLKADTAHTAPVQGSDGGRAQGETTREAEKEVNACECGCGGFPKDPASAFYPVMIYGKPIKTKGSRHRIRSQSHLCKS